MSTKKGYSFNVIHYLLRNEKLEHPGLCYLVKYKFISLRFNPECSPMWIQGSEMPYDLNDLIFFAIH